jgi:hypothetical protein
MPTLQERMKVIEDAKASLARMAEFDVHVLPRKDVLGSAFSFDEAVEPAQRIIELYKSIPPQVVDSLSINLMNALRNRADGDHQLLQNIAEFSPNSPNPKAERDNRIVRLRDAYDSCFDTLSPVITYAVRKSTDFARLEDEAKQTIRAMQETGARFSETMKTQSGEAQAILETIRKAAAEQGVSQQAIYFKTEADGHREESHRWLRITVWMTVVLVGYALLALFLHKVPWLAPTNTYEYIQLTMSKVFIFAAISFVVVLAAKNFSGHKHNWVVNKHRQNALVTYEALVKAAGDSANRDIVLTQASECIFSPQSTGFSRAEATDNAPSSILSFGPNTLKPT